MTNLLSWMWRGVQSGSSSIECDALRGEAGSRCDCLRSVRHTKHQDGRSCYD